MMKICYRNDAKKLGLRLQVLAALWALSLVGFMATAHAATDVKTPKVNLESLLDEMVDYQAVARWPQPNFTCKQVSSYDRASVAPNQAGWFANNDHSNYLRSEATDAQPENVLMDVDGPGAIVRFWMTSNDKRRGKLRIYLDGATIPALEWNAYNLMESGLVPSPLLHPHPSYRVDGGGGSTLYLPIPYARHCKVTWQAADETQTGPRYYQINYRTYPTPTQVETFSLAELKRAQKQIEGVCQNLLQPPSVIKGQATRLLQVLAAGKSAALALPAGPAAVQQLELSLRTANAQDLEQALRGVIIKMNFDGEDTVWCPASDFAGSGVGKGELQSWYRTVASDGTMTCRWVMPYRQSGRIELQNLSSSTVTAQLQARTGAWRWDERSMHFHANWRQQSEVPTKPDSDWNFIAIQGRGVLVGDVLAVFNPVPYWYGEGDEKIWVDNETFPSHFGTGTEDYYNSSWAPTPIYQTPFANGSRVDQWQSQGHNTYTRTRNLDTIPFQNSLRFDMEIEHWRDPKIDIAATTYWYGFPNATSNRAPQPEQATRALPTLAKLDSWFKVPDAIEFEKLEVLAHSANVSVAPQDMLPFEGRWSENAHLLMKAQKIGDYIELLIPASAGRHRLILRATQAPDYGRLRFLIDGQLVNKEFDGYAPAVGVAEPFELGTFTAHNGFFKLRVEVVGANEKSSGLKYLCGLDCLIVQTVR